MDELLKIRGMTKEILYGSKNKGDEDKKYKGIINHLTIYKIPTVNPNTASKEVLDILYEPEQVNKILKNTGLKIVMQEYRVFFPAFLKILRPSEQYLKWFPLGGQYFVIAKKY